MVALAEILNDEELRVAAWRIEQLQALGCDDDTAEAVGLGTTDVHEVAALVDAGCPLAVALRITEPV